MPTVTFAMPNCIANSDIVGHLDSNIREVRAGGSQAATDTNSIIYLPDRFATSSVTVPLSYEGGV